MQTPVAELTREAGELTFTADNFVDAHSPLVRELAERKIGGEGHRVSIDAGREFS